jgi:hypothetical protein
MTRIELHQQLDDILDLHAAGYPDIPHYHVLTVIQETVQEYLRDLDHENALDSDRRSRIERRPH